MAKMYLFVETSKPSDHGLFFDEGKRATTYFRKALQNRTQYLAQISYSSRIEFHHGEYESRYLLECEDTLVGKIRAEVKFDLDRLFGNAASQVHILDADQPMHYVAEFDSLTHSNKDQFGDHIHAYHLKTNAGDAAMMVSNITKHHAEKKRIEVTGTLSRIQTYRKVAGDLVNTLLPRGHRKDPVFFYEDLRIGNQ